MRRIAEDPEFYPAYEAALPEEIYQHYKPDLPGNKSGYIRTFTETIENLKNDIQQALIETFDGARKEGLLKGRYPVEVYIRFDPSKGRCEEVIRDLAYIMHLTDTADWSWGIFYTIPELLKYIIEQEMKAEQLREQVRENPGRTRVSGHMIEQGTLPSKKRYQPDLFIEQFAKDTTNLELVTRKGIGITYTPGESQLVNALQDMLWERILEEGYDASSRDKLPILGAEPRDAIALEVSDGKLIRRPSNLQAPLLAVTLLEVTKRFKGKGRVGGKDMKEVYDIVQELADNPDKKPLIFYQVTRKLQKKDVKVLTSYHLPLVDIVNRDIQITDRETGKTNHHKELLIVLNPVFTHQLETKMVFRPTGINRLLADANEKAHGHRKIGQVTHDLYRELLHAKAQNNGKRDEAGNTLYRIGHDRLVDKIAPGYKGRVKQTLQRMDTAIKTLKELGLVLEYRREIDTKGRPRMHVFTLNRGH